MDKTQFSPNYSLVVEKGGGDCWVAILQGPHTFRNDCISRLNGEDAKAKAYEFAVEKFVATAIGESHVSRGSLSWSSE